MQIGDAYEVVEAGSVTVANRMLSEGWKLLAVVPGTVPGSGDSYVVYVLGKPKPGGKGLYNQPVSG